MDERLEFYWFTLNKTMDHIKSSDGKASLLLSVYGILLSIVFSQQKASLEAVQDWPFFGKLLFILTITASVISIYFAFNTVNPRLKNPTPTSIIYFGDIHKKYKTAEQYYEAGKKRFKDADAIFKDLSDQVYVNSTIAYKKFFNVSWALRFFVLSIASYLLTNLIV